MRITNVDTLSAYFDRLITERIKMNKKEKLSHEELTQSYSTMLASYKWTR
jgi:hypothetical protein